MTSGRHRTDRCFDLRRRRSHPPTEPRRLANPANHRVNDWSRRIRLLSHTAVGNDVLTCYVSECSMGSPTLASGYDAESGLRLVQVRGRWDIAEFARLAPQDPTVAHMAECVSIVDLRGMDLSTSPGEIEQLAADRRGHAEAPFELRYAWVIDSQKMAGIAILYGRMMGAARIKMFKSIEEALAHFDLGFDAYLRAEQSLQPFGE